MSTNVCIVETKIIPSLSQCTATVLYLFLSVVGHMASSLANLIRRTTVSQIWLLPMQSGALFILLEKRTCATICCRPATWNAGKRKSAVIATPWTHVVPQCSKAYSENSVGRYNV